MGLKAKKQQASKQSKPEIKKKDAIWRRLLCLSVIFFKIICVWRNFIKLYFHYNHKMNSTETNGTPQHEEYQYLNTIKEIIERGK